VKLKDGLIFELYIDKYDDDAAEVVADTNVLSREANVLSVSTVLVKT